MFVLFLVFLSNSLLTCENSSIPSGRSYELCSGSVVISNCVFTRVSTYSGSGGVFYGVDLDKTQISDSVFVKCSANSHGGAIFCVSTELVLQMICAELCNSGSQNGQFIYLESLNNENRFSTCFKCSNSYSGVGAFFISRSESDLSNLNFSNNQAYDAAAIKFTNSNQTTKLCTFYNNLVSHWDCLWLSATKGNVYNSNIIKNNSPVGDAVVYNGGFGNNSFSNCVFTENSNILIYVYSGSVYLQSCFIQHSSTILKYLSGTIHTNNVQYTKVPALTLMHLKTANCDALVPFIKSTQSFHIIHRHRIVLLFFVFL